MKTFPACRSPRRRRRRALLAMAIFGCLALPALPAEDRAPDAVARELLRHAVRAERSVRGEDEARAWYRAAAACYRYYVLPVRLTQLDYFHEAGLLIPSDFDELRALHGGKADAATEIDGMTHFLTTREELVRYYDERARLALDRALAIESHMAFRSAGLVPSEPAAARDAVEGLLEHVAIDGVYEYLLAQRHPEFADIAESRDRRRQLDQILGEWVEAENYPALAESEEYASRLVRDTALAYCEAALASLAKSTDVDLVTHYREWAARMRALLDSHSREATRYYLAAASARDGAGDVVRAMIYSERARRLAGHEAIPAP